MPKTRTRSAAATRASNVPGNDAERPRPLIFPSAERGANQFAGRDWVVDQVVDWMDHGTERFFLLVGEPGWGKSSLSAWMIGAGRKPADARGRKRLEKLQQSFSAAHLCAATSGSTVNPSTFATSIAKQLAWRFDDFAAAFVKRAAPGQFNVNITADEVFGRVIGILAKSIIVEAADPKDVYEQSVRQPLEDVATSAPGAAPIFILVDGLDDALTFGSTTIVDLVAGSTDFPERVRFFLTTRNEDRVLSRFPRAAGVRVATVSDAVNDEANAADLRAWTAERLAEPPLAAWAAGLGDRRDAMIDGLVTEAAGNFLFIGFVLDDLSRAGGTGGGEREALPRNLQDAYTDFLGRVMPRMREYGDDPDWKTEYQPLLGTLSVAVPAAPQSAIPLWLGVEDGDLNQALGTVGQITEWVSDGDGGGRRLFHRSLADYLGLTSLPSDTGAPSPNRFFVQPREQHRRIADYYLQAIEGEWGGDWTKCDHYGLRQLVPHLYALARLTRAPAERTKIADQLCDLALDRTFQAAQRSALGGGAATIEAIRLALEISAETGDAAAIRKRARAVAESWEPEMRTLAARTLRDLGRTDPKSALAELKDLLR